MRNILLPLLLSIAAIAVAQTANYPFPQNVTYPHGIMPENISNDTLMAAYEHWKTKYVTASGAPKGRRVIWDDGHSTVSEGMGYGMLIAVYMDDQKLFDDFWAYYNSFPNLHGLMNWKVDGRGNVTGENAATDAEEDVAFALIMAHHQWGSVKEKGKVRYDKAAKSMLYRMMDYEVEAGTYVLKPGDMWGGSKTTNPSYFAPAYFRVYAQFSNNKSWLRVAEKSYEILEKSMNKETGLVPDWCNAEGGQAAGVGWARENGNCYLYDAARTPWRIGLDYLLYGTKEAYDYCTTVSDFIDKMSVFRIRDGYKLDGTRIGDNHNSTFIGPFGVGIMATDSTYQNLCNLAYIRNEQVFSNSYFNDCLRILTLLIQTGNMWVPEEYLVQE